jgi:hypothetical protein
VHRERAAQATARHPWPADTREFEITGTLLTKRLNQARADGVAPWFSGQQEDPA